MKKVVIVLFLALSFQAKALTLSSGESANINGTTVACKSAMNKCSVFDGGGDCVMISIANHKADGQCYTLDQAIAEIAKMRSAGLCN